MLRKLTAGETPMFHIDWQAPWSALVQLDWRELWSNLVHFGTPDTSTHPVSLVEKLVRPVLVYLLLVFLLLVKVAATCLTLGSGGSGGIIAPSLFLGATAGALLGTVLESAGPHADQGAV